MRNCFDEGKLQTWSDGALNAKEAANVAAHVNLCARCAETARTIEAENLIVTEGLASEFAAAVPSDRLRQRLNTAVAALQYPDVPVVTQSRWRAALESFALFRPLAYASIAVAVLFAGILGFVYLKNERIPAAIAAQTVPGFGFPVIATELLKEDQPVSVPIAVPTASRNSARARASLARNPNRTYRPEAMSLAWQESQYQYAIAKLNEAIKIQPPMRPSMQVEYEYNMAVINSAIATTRDAARRKPNDPLAAQFMLTAYQSKVDLLNEVANAAEK